MVQNILAQEKDIEESNHKKRQIYLKKLLKKMIKIPLI